MTNSKNLKRRIGSVSSAAGGGGVAGLNDAAAVAITGGTITGITDLAVADGGTGASTAANARTNLGLVIGTDVPSLASTTVITANRQVASYTAVLTDAGKEIEMNVGSANTLSIPENATVAFATDTVLSVLNYGAGACTITPVGAVTFRYPTGSSLILQQYQTAAFRKLATNEWYVTISGPEPEVIGIALSDDTTAITTGASKGTMRMPFAMTLTFVRANLNTASSSGIPTVDINVTGLTILSTKLTIDATELTSTTAAVTHVLSSTAVADDAEVTFDIDVAGTGAKGLKVWLIGYRT